MISKYENGYPVKIKTNAKGIIGRIVGQCEEGSWGETNGIKAFSISEIATPHGSILKSGLFHLEDLDDFEMKLLLQYEDDARKNGLELYAGRLDGILVNIEKCQFKKGDIFYIADYKNNLVYQREVLDVIEGRIYWNFRDETVEQSIPEWFNGRKTPEEAIADYNEEKNIAINKYKHAIKRISKKLASIENKKPMLTDELNEHLKEVI